MSKKLGDDRSRDRDLDTDMNFEELDRMGTNDPFGGSMGIDEGNGRNPAKSTKLMVTEGAKGAAKGAMSVIGEEVERNMPNLYTVKTELSDTYEDLKDMKDEIAKQLQPMMVSMENSARKILPRVSKLMPKSWYDKTMKKLDERAAERSGGVGPSREQERADLISSELSQMFGQQMEINKHNEFEHNKERLMDRAISSTQHKASQHAMTRIYDSVRSTELFHRTLHTAYMKKSLELKYKHLFVAQDTHNLLAKSLDAFEGYFKGIVKNTGLPDIMKTQASDYIKQARTQRYGTLMADYLTNARKMIFDKLKSSVKDMMSGLGMGAMALGTGADMLEMADDPMMNPGGLKGMAAGMVGKMAGRFAAGGPVRALMDKISPYTTAINDRLTNVKTRAYMGLNRLRKDWSRSGGFFKELMASFLPSISAPTTITNDLLTDAEDAAVFDKATRASIVEIIPGYLGKIWHAVEKINDPNAKEQTFNLYKRDFTSVEEYQKDLLTDSRMFGGTSTMTNALGEARAALKTGNERKGALHGEEALEGTNETISRIISNISGYREDFNPIEFVKFVRAKNNKQRMEVLNGEYLSKVSEGIEYDDFFRAANAIVNGLTLKSGKLDRELVRRFSDAIDSARANTDGMIERMPWAREAIGASRFLREKAGQQGLFRDDGTTNLAFANARSANYGKDEDVDAYTKMHARYLKESMENTDYVKGQMKKFYDNSKAAQAVVGAYKGMRSRWKAGGKESDGVELGPTNPSVAAQLIKPSTSVLRAFTQKFFDNAAVLVQQEPGCLDEINDIIREANDKFSEIDRLDVSDKTKIPMWQAAKDKILSKHNVVIGKINTINRSKMAKSVLGGVARVAETVGMTKIADKLRGAQAAVPMSSKEWRAKWTETKTSWKKKYDDILSGAENMTEEQAEQFVETECTKAANILSNLPENISKSELAEVIKGNRKLRDVLHEKYPNSKAVKQFDNLIQAVSESREVKAAMNVASVGKKMVMKRVQPHIDTFKTWSTRKYKKLKGFASDKLVDLVAKTGLDPDYVRRAMEGDEEARTVVMQYLKEAAGDKWGDYKKELTKDALAKKWIDVKADLDPNKLATKAGEKTSIARKFISGLAASFRQGAGIEDTAADTSSSESTASAEDSSELYGLVKAFHKSTSAEHQGIMDLIQFAINRLKVGVPALSSKESDKNPRPAEMEAIGRKQYGIFGKGGATIGKMVRGVVNAGIWTARKTGGIWAGLWEKGIEVGGSALGGIVGGIKRVGGWMTNTAGLNPYVDIYVKGQEDRRPVLSWRKQAMGKGVYYGKLEGNTWVMSDERVMNSSDIPKRGVPIFDPKTGNMLIDEDALEAGLWAAQGPLSAITRVATAGVRGFADIYSAALKGIGAVGKVVAEGLFGQSAKQAEQYCDIYLKGKVNGKPLVTRRQQEDPGVFFVEDGKRVERSSDIHSPIMDEDKQILIDEKDLKRGLVDVNNKPLGSAIGGRQGLIGKAFDLGGIMAKGIFGKTGMKIIGGALGGLGAIYKGMFSALLGGTKSIGRGIANIGARLFGFDTPTGFGSKAFKGLNTRLDRLIELVGQIAAHGGGGGGGTISGATNNGGSGYAPNDDGDPIHGREGFWGKDGKFHARKGGPDFEYDGPNKKGGAKAARENAKASVHVSAKDNYVETTHDLPESEGGDDGDEGMDLTDALLMSEFVPEGVKRRIRNGKKWLKNKKTSLKNNVKSRWKRATKAKGGVKGKAKAFFKKGGRTKIPRGVRAGRIGRVAKLGRTGRFLSKFGVAGKVAGLGLKGLGLLGKGAIRAPSAIAGGTIAAAKATPGALRATGRAGKFLGTGAVKAVGGYAGRVGRLANGALGKAAAPLALLMAGAAAQDARENANQILGTENATEGQKDIAASSAAMDSMSSGALLGLDHLILGKNVNNWIGEKLYGDENAGAQARDYIDQELGIQNINMSTNLRGKLGKDAAWYNPLVWGANIVDGATGVANDLAKGSVRIIGGTGKAIGQSIKNYFDEKEANEKWEKTKVKVEAQKKLVDEAFAKASEGIDCCGRSASVLFQMFKRRDGVTRERLDKAVAKYGNVYKDPELMKQWGNWMKDNFPPKGDAKARLAYFSKLYHNPKRDETDRAILKSFGIDHPQSEAEWKVALKNLENESGSKIEDVPKDAAAAAVASLGGKDTNHKPVLGSPLEKDPVKRFEAFKKIYSDKDRATKYDKGLLQAYGIDFPDDQEEWTNAYKDLEKKASEAKAKDPDKYKVTNADKAAVTSANVGKDSTLPTSGSGSDSQTAISSKNGYGKVNGVDLDETMKKFVVENGGTEGVTKLSKEDFISKFKAFVGGKIPEATVTKIAEQAYKDSKENPEILMGEGDRRWRGLRDSEGNRVRPEVAFHDSQKWVNGQLVENKGGGMLGNKTEGWEWDKHDREGLTKWTDGKSEYKKHSDLTDAELGELMSTYNSKAAKKGGWTNTAYNQGRDRALAEFRRRLAVVRDEYVKEIGGEEAVKKMTKKEFLDGLREYAKSKGVFDRMKGSPYEIRGMYSGNLAKLGAQTWDANDPNAAPEMSDISKDLLLMNMDKFKKPIDVTQLTPPKLGDLVSPDQLALQSGMIQKNGVAKVTGAIKSSAVTPQLTQMQMEELLKDTQKALMGYSKFSESFADVMSPEGLKVSGIPELAAITASKPSGGTKEIIREIPVQQDMGLDLRAQQL